MSDCAVSTDMLHWAHLPIALTPDHDYDCGGEFSGSATVLPTPQFTADGDAGTPVLSVSVACGKWVFFAIPALDRKTDPLIINWTKSGTMPGSGAKFNGPLFDKPACSPGGFRDPTSAWKGPDGMWRMATGCGGPPTNVAPPAAADTKNGTMVENTDLSGDDTHISKGAKGGACLFKSKNFVNWTSEGFLHQSVEPNNPGFWECPVRTRLHVERVAVCTKFTSFQDMFPIPGSDKWVLKGSCGGDWWTVGDYAMGAKDSFKPISYDMHGGDPSGLGKQQCESSLPHLCRVPIRAAVPWQLKRRALRAVLAPARDPSLALRACFADDFGKFYASKSFYDPSKDRQVLWGWVAEEGPVSRARAAWFDSSMCLRRVVGSICV
eukprot:SAG11_NODE_83_length_17378_cov_5.388622_8_plen_379_part_00